LRPRLIGYLQEDQNQTGSAYTQCPVCASQRHYSRWRFRSATQGLTHRSSVAAAARSLACATRPSNRESPWIALMQVFGTQEQGYAIFRELSESFEASSCPHHCAPLVAESGTSIPCRACSHPPSIACCEKHAPACQAARMFFQRLPPLARASTHFRIAQPAY